jgi:hypothetical protein
VRFIFHSIKGKGKWCGVKVTGGVYRELRLFLLWSAIKFSFISDDDEGSGLTKTAMVTGVERASLFILGGRESILLQYDGAWRVGFDVVAGRFFIMGTGGRQVTDDDGIIFHLSSFSLVTMTRVMG